MVMVRKHLNKKIVVCGLMALGVCTLAGGAYATWLMIPPPLPQTPQQALRTIGTGRYERMPDYRKAEYLDQARRLLDEVPPEQRRELFQQARTDENVRQALGRVRQHERVQRALTFANANPDERVQLLDDAIDRMEERRARMRANRPDASRRDRSGSEGREDRRSRGRERFLARFEHGNPQINSLIGEYHRAMRQRRQERKSR